MSKDIYKEIKELEEIAKSLGIMKADGDEDEKGNKIPDGVGKPAPEESAPAHAPDMEGSPAPAPEAPAPDMEGSPAPEAPAEDPADPSAESMGQDPRMDKISQLVQMIPREDLQMLVEQAQAILSQPTMEEQMSDVVKSVNSLKTMTEEFKSLKAEIDSLKNELKNAKTQSPETVVKSNQDKKPKVEASPTQYETVHKSSDKEEIYNEMLDKKGVIEYIKKSSNKNPVFGNLMYDAVRANDSKRLRELYNKASEMGLEIPLKKKK